METKKKILMIIVALVIIIGAVVIGIKGFNVSLYLKDHDTLEYVFEQKFDIDDVKEFCKEVFGDKKFEVRTVEIFDDSVYIMAETISDDEKDALLENLVNLYSEDEETSEEVSEEQITENVEETTEESTEAEETAESETSDEVTEETETTETSIADSLIQGTDYEFYHDNKIQLRDLLKPYITPTIIAAVIIIICMIIRYKILKPGKVILETLKIVAKSIVVALFVLAVVAIVRIPVSSWILPGVMFFVLIYLVVAFEMEIRRKAE